MRSERHGVLQRRDVRRPVRASSAPSRASRRQAPVHHFLETRLFSREPRNNTLGLIK